MKKVLSFIIAITLVMFSTIPAFAVENENNISPEVENEIKQLVIEYRELTDKYNCEDVDIKYMYTLSDDSILFNYSIGNSVSITAIVEFIIGKYSYQLTPKYVEHIYKNGKVYSLKEAYYNKIISDEVIDEIAKELKMKKISNVNLYPDPELKNIYDWGFSSDIEIAFTEYYGLPSNNNPEFLIADVLSNGNMLVYYTSEDITLSDEVKEMKIGNYIYKTSDADMAYLCVLEKDEEGFGYYKLYKLNEAYEKGVIDDKILDESAKVLNLETVEQPATQPATQPETKPSNTQNGAIPTGQSNTILLLGMLLAVITASSIFTLKVKR